MPVIVDALCNAGADVNAVDEKGDSALWLALESGQEDVASILVSSSHCRNVLKWIWVFASSFIFKMSFALLMSLC